MHFSNLFYSACARELFMGVFCSFGICILLRALFHFQILCCDLLSHSFLVYIFYCLQLLTKIELAI